jgi:hypothetical protein
LERLYATDHRASGKSIYVVFWFGDSAHLQSLPLGLPRPNSPEEMKRILTDSPPADRSASIAVVVLDLTRSAPRVKAKQRKNPKA